jgi:hypothetical protein
VLRRGRVLTHVRFVLALMPAVGLLVPARPAHTATIAVPCNTAALIAPINTANGTPGADTLQLDAGCTYVLTA